MDPAVNRGANVTDADLGRIRRVIPLFTFDAVLQTTGKCKILSGMVEGQPAIAKVLFSTDRQWVQRFRHEIQFYRTAKRVSAPVAIPKVYATDEHELVMVEERVQGSPLANARYLDRGMNHRASESLLRAMRAIGEWQPWPPVSRNDALASLESMLTKGVNAGIVDTSQRDAVVRTVNALDWAPEFSHGDLLPSNCMSAPDGRTLTLVDWEYADYRLPCYDLALVFMVAFQSGSVRNAIGQEVMRRDTTRRLLFLANLAALLTREVRILQKAQHVAGFPERETEMSNLLELTWEWLWLAEREPAQLEIPFGDEC